MRIRCHFCVAKLKDESRKLKAYFSQIKHVVIDMLLFKATEELKDIVDHAKQRHHVVGQYVVGRHKLEQQELGSKGQTISPFLQNFYKTNYF